MQDSLSIQAISLTSEQCHILLVLAMFIGLQLTGGHIGCLQPQHFCCDGGKICCNEMQMLLV